ncbi:DsbA family oxidoreductase [Vulgatibacter incomptus]|uniref:DSBA-like thioredoxin domain-containing protein n=1 Tax=Vulgatibacter incomptus TaxID=1391653 RepID=A0A0K1PI91_9BACT|nr:DsbA family protein [Vulgatibacter incomptus]AKU92829.1 hypothetical protein AKJ08_3216 [Vulgatibacter incomptus]
MSKLLEPIELVLHHDVLCGWSLIADARLRHLKEEMGDALRIELRPFPIRLDERVPSRREIQAETSALRKVAKEKEGKGIVADLWRSNDPPRSSLPPLVALEAARIIGGEAAQERLLRALRRAAFHHGVNVTRDDVLLELAERCGIETARFATALRAQGTRRLVTDAQDEALFHGIDSVPSLVIGGEWLVAGVRSVDEYRDTIRRFGEQNGLFVPERMVH